MTFVRLLHPCVYLPTDTVSQVLGCSITAVFAAGLFKLWIMNRKAQRDEIIDREKMIRTQEMRKCGLRVRREAEIPFGVRALQAGIEVEGIWAVSRGTEAVDSNICPMGPARHSQHTRERNDIMVTQPSLYDVPENSHDTGEMAIQLPAGRTSSRDTGPRAPRTGYPSYLRKQNQFESIRNLDSQSQVPQPNQDRRAVVVTAAGRGGRESRSGGMQRHNSIKPALDQATTHPAFQQGSQPAVKRPTGSTRPRPPFIVPELERLRRIEPPRAYTPHPPEQPLSRDGTVSPVATASSPRYIPKGPRQSLRGPALVNGASYASRAAARNTAAGYATRTDREYIEDRHGGRAAGGVYTGP